MKYVGITKGGKIRCTRKDGETKDYSAEKPVIEYAKNNFKKDDIVIGEFKKGVLVKLSKRQIKQDTTKSYSNNYKNSDNIDRQSAVKSASVALTAIDGITVDNYEEVYTNLIVMGLNAINGKSTVTKTTNDELVNEDSVLENEELEDNSDLVE